MMHHRKLIDSFRYALMGIAFSIRENQNFRVHIVISMLVILAAIFFKVSPFEMGILGVAILLVFAAEMINSAIEEMVDLITKEHREEAKIAKDVSAGMVLVCAIGSTIVGVLIFLPHILHLFR